MEYTIRVNRFVGDLVLDVNKMIEKGFSPQGGIVETEKGFVQAMVSGIPEHEKIKNKRIMALIESIDEKVNSIETDLITIASAVGVEKQGLGYIRVDK